MQEKKRICFCKQCGKETEYLLQKKYVVKNIKDKDYIFSITVANCAECKGELSIREIATRNEREIEEQYRRTEGLVSLEEIEKLMSIYKIGKGPLSLALGFGEVTIPRYFEGQMPAKDYSDLVKLALSSPSFMKKSLQINRNKMTQTAYRKALSAIKRIERQFHVTDRLLGVIALVFKTLGPVSPSTLQSLLYFVQGVHMAVNGYPIFDEDCVAGIDGPLFVEVQELFKDMTFNPMDDPRYMIVKGKESELLPAEREVVERVASIFGVYGGKILMGIAREETPWREARKGYGEGIPCDEVIPKELIGDYYRELFADAAIGFDMVLKARLRKKIG